MPRYLLDLAERTAATYGQAFIGLLLADTANLTSVGTLRAAAIAAVPAGLAVIKGALAYFLGEPNTASLLPSPAPAPAAPSAADTRPM
jgi:hypothetical protein